MRRNIFLMLAICLSAFVFSTAALAQQRFVGSLTGAQEVPANNSTGKGTCTIVLNSTETQMTVNCTYSGLSSAASAGHIHDAGPVGVSGPVRFGFTGVTGTSGTIGPFSFNPTPAQIADLRAKKWYFNIHTANFPGGEIRGQVKPSTQPVDNDGDARTDLRVLRSAENGLYTLNSINNSLSFNSLVGTSTVYSSNDDYDGDGRSDIVTFAAEGTARVWRILLTGTNTVRQVQWGSTAATDQVLPADYDGDGKSDIAIYRRDTGIWYIIRSSDNQTQAEVFGTAPGDIGVVGDFDKDGKNDLTTIRSSTGNGFPWFTRRSSDGVTQTVLWGGPPTPAGDTVFTSAQIDIDGDGRQDHMVVRDSNGSATTGGTYTFFILRSSDGQQFTLPWGVDTDIYRYGDYDGDGKTDIAARRTENGLYNWYIYQSSTGQGRVVTFGGTGDARIAESEEEVNSQIELF